MQRPRKDHDTADQPAHPIGAITLTLAFLITLVILWSWVFFIMVERGVTR